MNKDLKIDLPKDKKGYTGRECPSCGKYFKVKFGTGLPITSQICPYCGHRNNGSKFLTQDQTEYIRCVVHNEVFVPEMEKLIEYLKSLKHFKPPNTPIRLPITQYQEKILETEVICDNCGLNFSIYGVFSDCPDCGQLNAKVMFIKSIESSIKKLKLYEDESLDPFIKKDLPKYVLNDSVSSFDALGKALIKKHGMHSKTKNLFQNLDELNNFLQSKFNKSVVDYISGEGFKLLSKMFQVRHIYEHNAGVIDNRFITKIPEYNNSLGRLYPLTIEEIGKFLIITQELGTKIFYEFERKDS